MSTIRSISYNALSTEDKYLIFDSANCIPAGLDHKLSTLKSAIIEALSLNRILVLGPFSILPYQNLVYTTQTQAFKLSNYKTPDTNAKHIIQYLHFEDYINLEKTKIYKLEDCGNISLMPFRYLNEEDFDLSAYTDEPEQILEIKTTRLTSELPIRKSQAINKHILLMENNRLLTAQQNNQYKVVVRRTNIYNYSDAKTRKFLVRFYPSDKVEDLTDNVLKSLGTCRDDAKRLNDFYQNTGSLETKNNYRSHYLRDYPLYYAGLHVRANDALYSGHIKFAADPRQLKRVLRRAIPKGIKLYIMSDIVDPHYYDFLRKDYIVYRYQDFAELNALVSGSNGFPIDNAMLYSVEKNILQYAQIKIARTRRKPKLLYINAAYTTPWRYKLMELYGYLKANLAGILRYSIPLKRVIRNAYAILELTINPLRRL